MQMRGQLHAPDDLPPGKNTYVGVKVGWGPEPSGHGEQDINPCSFWKSIPGLKARR